MSRFYIMSQFDGNSKLNNSGFISSLNVHVFAELEKE